MIPDHDTWRAANLLNPRT